MKKVLLVMAVAFLFSSVSFATGNVKIDGNPGADDKLLITLDWTVDTNDYRNGSGQILTQEKIRAKVGKEMEEIAIPMLVDATKGRNVSYGDDRFETLEENVKVVSQRSDNSKVVKVLIKVEFNNKEIATPVVKEKVKYVEASPRFSGAFN